MLKQWYNPFHMLMALISNVSLGQKILHKWNKMYSKEFASKVQPADGMVWTVYTVIPGSASSRASLALMRLSLSSFSRVNLPS